MIDEIKVKGDFLNWILHSWLGDKFLPLEVKKAIMAACQSWPTFRSKCGCLQNDKAASVDLTWRAGWSAGADKVMELIEATRFRLPQIRLGAFSL